MAVKLIAVIGETGPISWSIDGNDADNEKGPADGLLEIHLVGRIDRADWLEKVSGEWMLSVTTLRRELHGVMSLPWLNGVDVAPVSVSKGQLAGSFILTANIA